MKHYTYRHKPEFMDRVFQIVPVLVLATALIFVLIGMAASYAPTDETNEASDLFIAIVQKYGAPFLIGFIVCMLLFLNRSNRKQIRQKRMREILSILDDE